MVIDQHKTQYRCLFNLILSQTCWKINVGLKILWRRPITPAGADLMEKFLRKMVMSVISDIYCYNGFRGTAYVIL